MKLTDYFVHALLISYLFVIGIFNKNAKLRAKRMLLLTTLAVTLAEEGLVRKNAPDLIGKQFDFDSEDTIYLSKVFGKSIWNVAVLTAKGRINDITGMASINEIKQVVDDVKDVSPKWLNYGSQMDDDLTVFFINTCQHK